MFQRRFLLGLVASFLSFDLYVIVALGAVHHVVQMKSLETASSCSLSAKGPARGLRIGHRYGPCSPLTPKNSARRLSQILIRDESRVHSINSLSSNNNPTNELPVVNRHIGNGNFVVTVAFGTPKRNFTLIFDTGSDFTWIKCKPCAGKNCDSTKNPSYYNPSISSTFLNCTAIRNSSCAFEANYTDHSFSNGYYVRDTLTLTPSDVFPNFTFGCSQQKSKDMFGDADGLLGVGPSGSYSLIPQTQQKFGKIFCYCLPANVDSTGYLLFGEDAVETCQTNKFTPLLSLLNKPYYIVHLIGITIGNQRLNVSSNVFSKSETILDSATVITRLPQSVYSELRSAFRASMSQYQIAPSMDQMLDTCYQVKKNENAKIPSMVMHYAGLDVNLNSSSTVKWNEQGTQACLAFAAKKDSDSTIIGNHQQLNLNVFYNIPERKVSFGTGGCGN